MDRKEKARKRRAKRKGKSPGKVAKAVCYLCDRPILSRVMVDVFMPYGLGPQVFKLCKECWRKKDEVENKFYAGVGNER